MKEIEVTMDKTETKKVKQSSAQKRDIQNEKRRLRNRVYKSRVRTAIRALQTTLDEGKKEIVQEKLNAAYSILDKCAQKGVFKLNKVSRTKARLAARTVAHSAS
jgi:small subunit ribosomal protein S20